MANAMAEIARLRAEVARMSGASAIPRVDPWQREQERMRRAKAKAREEGWLTRIDDTLYMVKGTNVYEYDDAEEGGVGAYVGQLRPDGTLDRAPKVVSEPVRGGPGPGGYVPSNIPPYRPERGFRVW